MARQPQQQVLTKKHLARLEKERIQRRNLIIATVAVLVLVVGIVLYGVLDQTVFKTIAPVAKVGNQTVTTGAFQKEVKFERFRLIDQLKSMTSNSMYLQFFGSYVQQIGNQLNTPNAMGQQVLDSMVEDILVQQEAQKRGITVSDAEVNKSFQEAFGYAPGGTSTPTVTETPFLTETLNPTQKALLPPTSTPNPTTTAVAETAVAVAETKTATVLPPTATPLVTSTPTETPTPTSQFTPTITLTPTITPTSTITPTPTPYTTQAYATIVNNYVGNTKAIGYSEADLKALIRRQLLRQKVYDAITKDVPTTAEEVWARHILVKTEDEAKQVLARLAKGEKFDDLAKELSQDTTNKDQGGDLGWFTRGQMEKSFEDAAFSLKVGELSQPVKSTYGYHIIQVLGHETRPLTSQQLSDAKQKAYQDWLDAAKKANNVKTYDTTWQAAVPTEPAIPADIETVLNQLNAAGTDQSGLPIQSLPDTQQQGPQPTP